MNEQEREPHPAASFDADAFARNMTTAMEEGSRALSTMLAPNPPPPQEAKINLVATQMQEVFKTLGTVMEFWTADPRRAAEMQTTLGKAYLDLWGATARRMAGASDVPPVVEPGPRDKRFSDPQWSQNLFFDFIKQAYLLTAKWARDLVDGSEGLDPHTRHKAEFYITQITNAFAPSNFLLTNPEVLRETMESNGENLARGMKLLAEDVEAGQGSLRIRLTDTSKLEVGRDVAITPGKVVFQNELIQLIQYTPTTTRVFRTPLLIVPPWINKYYVLDLNPDKSFIRWAVEQGFTVFVISWVNPGRELAGKTFEDYMKRGVITAMDAIERATGEMKVHALGYCVGGTMLAVALAWLAAQRKVRVASATFLTTQVDFTYAGDLKVFIDEEQLAALDQAMQEAGVLEGGQMATTFNMLRSSDLIWPYVINNYMRGQNPPAFDLLYWNSDATRMTAANHSYYLRNCYLENRLTRGTMVIDNTLLDLSKVKMPVYNLATREDHIAPAKSVYLGSLFFGGPMRFVLSASGHIAGVVNPPAAKKYHYWTNEYSSARSLDDWLKTAVEHKGSWWPDWLAWIRAIDEEEVAARTPGSTGLLAIEDAPGSYVKVKA